MASKKRKQSCTDLALLAPGESAVKGPNRYQVGSKGELLELVGASWDRQESVVDNLRVRNEKQNVELEELQNELRRVNVEVAQLRKQNAAFKESQQQPESEVEKMHDGNAKQHTELKELRQQYECTLNELQRVNVEGDQLRKQNVEREESHQRLEDEFRTIYEDKKLCAIYVDGLHHDEVMATHIQSTRDAEYQLLSFVVRLRLAVVGSAPPEINNAVKVLSIGVSILYWIVPLLHFISTGDSSRMDDRVNLQRDLLEKLQPKDEH